MSNPCKLFFSYSLLRLLSFIIVGGGGLFFILALKDLFPKKYHMFWLSPKQSWYCLYIHLNLDFVLLLLLPFQIIKFPDFFPIYHICKNNDHINQQVTELLHKNECSFRLILKAI